MAEVERVNDAVKRHGVSNIPLPVKKDPPPREPRKDKAPVESAHDNYVKHRRRNAKKR